MKLLNKVKISLMFAFFIMILFNIKALAVTGVITEITVNLRKEPSTNGKKIMYVTQDDKVEVLEKVGEWYKIKAKGITGYVFGEYVKVDDSKLEEKEITTDVENNSKVEQSEEKENTSKTEQITKKEETQIEDVTIDGELKLQIKNKAQVRLIPNISSSVIYTAKKNISVTVIEQLDNWAYIFVENVYGWVRSDNIVEENATQTNKVEEKDEDGNSTIATSEEKVAYIKYDTVNLRKKASTSSNVLAKLKLNDKVTVIEKVDSKWSKVKVDGQVGYISTDLLADEKQKIVEKEENNTTSRDGESTSRDDSSTTKKEEIANEGKKDKETSEKKEESKNETTNNKVESTKKEETTNTTNNTETTKKEDTPSDKTTTTSKATGEDIVEYAKNYLGYKYVLGAASPKKGFDCSGLTYYVYKHFGYNISRTSKTQAKDGKEIARKDLKPGDLLIFKNQSLTAIGHVGIYIGNNKMIHSSEPGVGVVITDLDARGYNYNKRYVTARRIIN